jgi:hypothetical protein
VQGDALGDPAVGIDLSDCEDNGSDLVASDQMRDGQETFKDVTQECQQHRMGGDPGTALAASDGSSSDGKLQPGASWTSSGSDDVTGASNSSSGDGVAGAEGRTSWNVTDAELEGVNLLELPSPSDSSSPDSGQLDVQEDGSNGLGRLADGEEECASMSADDTSDVSFDEAAFLRATVPGSDSPGKGSSPRGSKNIGGQQTSEHVGQFQKARPRSLVSRESGGTRGVGQKRSNTGLDSLEQNKLATDAGPGRKGIKRRRAGSQGHVFAAYEDYVDVIEDIVQQRGSHRKGAQ